MRVAIYLSAEVGSDLGRDGSHDGEGQRAMCILGELKSALSSKGAGVRPAIPGIGL